MNNIEEIIVEIKNNTEASAKDDKEDYPEYEFGVYNPVIFLEKYLSEEKYDFYKDIIKKLKLRIKDAKDYFIYSIIDNTINGNDEEIKSYRFEFWKLAEKEEDFEQVIIEYDVEKGWTIFRKI